MATATVSRCSPVTPYWVKLSFSPNHEQRLEGNESYLYRKKKFLPQSTSDSKVTPNHNHILSSKRLNSALMQWSVRGCQEEALLHRSESQQWMRTPGSSCCWQCLDVAQPLVRTIPRAAVRTERGGGDRESVSQRRVMSCCQAQQEKKKKKHE